MSDYPATKTEVKPKRRKLREWSGNCWQVKGPDGVFRGGHHPSCHDYDPRAAAPKARGA